MTTLLIVERSPEKAGVGGSIPSLATIFSSTCECPFRRFGSIWFQLVPIHCTNCDPWITCEACVSVACLAANRC